MMSWLRDIHESKTKGKTKMPNTAADEQEFGLLSENMLSLLAETPPETHEPKVTTALHIVCAAGIKSEIERILKDGQVDVLAQNEAGQTALQLYCAYYIAHVARATAETSLTLGLFPENRIKKVAKYEVKSTDAIIRSLIKHVCIALLAKGFGDDYFLLDNEGNLTTYTTKDNYEAAIHSFKPRKMSGSR